ncbi:MAG: arginine--tRNA ligase [Bacilli bacterium]|nr:arginine--tRNA ligase [Bacilli bacterium]
MNLIDILEKEIKETLSKLGYLADARLIASNRPDLGDYQYNGAFALAKEYKENPNIIANKIAEVLKVNNNYSKVDVVGGFINLTINNKLLITYLNNLIKNPDINLFKMEKKKVIIDYGGANIAKELHVGHLRSANIGEALKRLFISAGYEMIGDVHLGDWGRPMGLIIKEIKEMYPDLPFFDKNFKGDYPTKCPVSAEELNDIYPRASIKANEDEDYLEDARAITTALQNGDKAYYALWRTFYELSSTDIKKIYNKLNASFELWEGESDAEAYIPEMMKYLKDNNLTTESDGALVINVKEETDNREIPPVILIKKDGGVLYHTTELATLYYRQKRFAPDAMIYLTDIRQELHFTQAFRAAYKTKIIPKTCTLEHQGFGTMNAPGGKPFKTRDGGVLSLKGLIKLVTDETRKLIKENIKEEEKDNLAENIAIAAIKYADLLPNRSSDYIFDPVMFSDLNGKTGPYLLYSTVRMKSLLSKCADAGLIPSEYKSLETKEEREIILNLLKMKSVLEKSINARSLNEIAEYLYKLTNSFNAFYGEHEILTSDNEVLRNNWVTLTKIVYDTNKRLLNILAITVPEKI